MSDLASAIGIRSEEQSLVADLKAGSEEAFSALIALYSQPVYSLISRSLRDPSDAADVTQDVFIKVFRSISGFHGDASLRTWIYRIAIHEVSNQRRWWSRHKRQELTIDTAHNGEDGDTFCLVDALAAQGESPFEHAARTELRGQVEKALHQLPEVFRTVVVLREIDGLGYEEMVAILGVSLGTVKSRLARGRAALREVLKISAEASDRRRRGNFEVSGSDPSASPIGKMESV